MQWQAGAYGMRETAGRKTDTGKGLTEAGKAQGLYKHQQEGVFFH